MGVDGTHRLWLPYHGGIFLQVPGTSPVGIRRQLARGDLELAESATEIGTVVMGAWT